jgi:hypothetical protein
MQESLYTEAKTWRILKGGGHWGEEHFINERKFTK